MIRTTCSTRWRKAAARRRTEVRLVEEEHELRLVQIADLGKVLEELRQEPQEESSNRAAASG
jgi:hypothetical protein